MKGVDIFCGSQAATAICITMEELASSSSSSSSCPASSTTILVGSGGSSPAIDRYNPIIKDSRRLSTLKPLIPPSNPSLTRHKKNKNKKIPPKQDNIGVHDVQKKIDSSTIPALDFKKNSWSCTRPAAGADFISPHGSTRYLLSEKIPFNSLSDSDPTPTPTPAQAQAPLELFPAETNPKLSNDVETNESCAAKPPSPNQVVVLRVSLHCRGCERKLRKHLSKMEGVRSFDIDFAAKKVTVRGNVTPVGVLSSISKVKNAQLWSPTISSSTVPVAVDIYNLSNSLEFKNDEFKGAADDDDDRRVNKGTSVGITFIPVNSSAFD